MKTLVLGASENPDRYSNKAINMLRDYGHEVVAIARREGRLRDVVFETEKVDFKDVHTVTLYLNPKNQESYLDYIVGLKPKRVIFNPGTENPDFYVTLIEANIEVQEACTLVLLRSNQYES